MIDNGLIDSDPPLGFRSFEFDLPTALLEQLIGVLDGMEQGLLIPKVASTVPNAQGVYQLFHRGRLVYIGKTDAQAGLRQRLSRHAWTIQSRHNLAVEDMTFKAVQVLVFSAMDLETALIAHYKVHSEPPVWNGSGFGSNDPGRRRDATALKEDGFDANYPVNIDLPLEAEFPAGLQAIAMLGQLIPMVPYTVRHERTAQAEADLRSAIVGGVNKATLRSVLEAVGSALPPGWQITKLPGRVIMYREYVDDYPGGEIIARSKNALP